MGSVGEEDLEKLVLDYMESSPITVSDHMEKTSTALTNLQEILGEKIEEEKEIEEKIDLFMEINRVSYEGDDEKRAMMKKIVSMLRSDGYDASFSKTSWDSCFDHREGCIVFRCPRKYEYIDVKVKDDVSKVKRVIVDLDFKSQFEMAKQTKAYKDMTERLPTVFVATEERLRRVVSLVCGEMKKSLKKEGMSRPPWRTSRYMQAMWQPDQYHRRVSGGGEEESQVKTMSESGSKTKCFFPIF